MPDFYRVPSLVLTLLLLPAFAYLYHRYRNTRTLLWLLGFLFALLRMGQMLLTDALGGGFRQHPWITLMGVISAQISAVLFLASLSPIRVYLGRIRLLYWFVIPVAACTVLVECTLLGLTSRDLLTWCFPVLAALSTVSALWWGWKNGAAPGWAGAGICGLAAITAGVVYIRSGAAMTLYAADSLTRIVTALLVIAIFRRFSPGVVLTVAGFLVWSAMTPRHFPGVAVTTDAQLYWIRFITMAKVVAAMGMILLTLEDELIAKKAAQERERKMRLQMEAYTELVYSHPKVAEFDGRTTKICQAITRLSQFRQAAFLMQDSLGHYQLAGAAGLEPARQKALGEAAGKIPLSSFFAMGTAEHAVEQCSAVKLDLAHWLSPGQRSSAKQDAEYYAIPLSGNSLIQGALLLAGMRDAATPAREDLLPLELFASRLEGARSKTILIEKLIHREKFASVGQLAESVTHQLNNPLTVILGYAALLEDRFGPASQERQFAAAILAQARQMKTTLESLTRASSVHREPSAAVSVAGLLSDLEQLHRAEFARRGIEFHLNVAPNLPRVRGQAQQLRTALQHCLQYGIEAVQTGEARGANKKIHMEARLEGEFVHIQLSHTGKSFADPDRAFDPLAEANNLAESRTMGLHLCATILNDNQGRARALTLEPRGAAIILELPIAWQ